ncbi:protein Star-like [Penaeus monodon]|uniref:protein Star-like n=1 Tax=Penaeus monodon TaxID=6687 RepID=UPI0018A6D838|nr:protein Star-like [Penaeus monodon]
MKPMDSATGRGKALRLAVTGLIAWASVHYISSISSETTSISQLEPQTKFSVHNPYSKREVRKRNRVQTPTRKTLRNPSKKKQELRTKPVPRVKILNITSFSGIDQNNPGLVAYVRQRMRPPAPTSQPYNLANPDKTDFSQCNQSAYADKEFLHGMTNGFFVEMGAVDGEIFSNSLYFERALNWTGLLVEPNPEDYQTLTTRGRKAYSMHAAVSPKNTSGMSIFNRRSQLFGRLGPDEGTGVPVWRFPLYAMLAALNVTVVDFLSLDVEGDELEVLQTIPWKKYHSPMGLDKPVKEGAPKS